LKPPTCSIWTNRNISGAHFFSGINLETVAARVSEVLKFEAGRLERPGKQRRTVAARSLYCYWAVRELGISLTELSRKLGLSVTAVSQCVRRGEALAAAKGYQLLTGLNIKQPGNNEPRTNV
jgi:hypothetical protein